MPKNIGYYTRRNLKKSLPDGGSITDKSDTTKVGPKIGRRLSKATNATFDFIDDPSMTPEEKQFVFSQVLKTTNPITGEDQSFGKLKEFFQNPSNRGQVKEHFRKTNPRVHSLKDNTEAFLLDAFDSSKGKFKQAAKANPRRNLVPTKAIGEILNNRPGFDTAIESAGDPFIEETLGFKPEAGTFKPTSFYNGGSMRQRKGQGGVDMLGEIGGGDSGITGGGNGFGGKAFDFFKKNADVFTSLGSTAFNIGAAGQLETEVTPNLARARRTPFKSALNETIRSNQASYQAYIDSLNESGANANLGRAIGIAGVTKANTAASIADAQAANQFNLGQDRLQAGINLSNVNTLNQAASANLGRRNRKLIEQTSAVTAGTQDLLNISAGKQALNQQTKELVLTAMQSGDTGVMERIASSMNMSVEELIQSIGDPSATLN